MVQIASPCLSVNRGPLPPLWSCLCGKNIVMPNTKLSKIKCHHITYTYIYCKIQVEYCYIVWRDTESITVQCLLLDYIPVLSMKSQNDWGHISFLSRHFETEWHWVHAVSMTYELIWHKTGYLLFVWCSITDPLTVSMIPGVTLIILLNENLLFLCCLSNSVQELK